jgi:hypothetical protein
MQRKANDPQYFLWRARKARTLADEASDAALREDLLKIAAEYEKRALKFGVEGGTKH